MSTSERVAAQPEGGPYRAEVGFEFPAEEIVITGDEQRRLHGWCDIEAAVFEGVADPTFVARRPILLNTAMIRQARPGWGQVHVVHRVKQIRPIALDEALVMCGRVTAVEPHPKGIAVRSEWTYRDAGGAVSFFVEPDVLMVDPDIEASARPARAQRGAEPESFEKLARKQCTPESTLGYCEGSENEIHLNPEYAHSFGFRAPIIAGMQTVNYLVEPIYRRLAPETLSLHIRFLRPVFWDDGLTIEGRFDDAGALTAVRAINGGAKCVADCAIES